MTWKNVFHLGPLLSIGIIKCISWATVHCNSLFWPPNQSLSGFCNSAFFILLSGLTLYNFFYSLQVGPGFLPLNWKPENEDDCQYLQFCTTCLGYKAPRSHHCRKCNRCILKRDHHCIFLNNCVGHQNHTTFVSFLFCAIVGCCQSCVIIGCTLYRVLNPIYFYYDDVGGIQEAPFFTIGFWQFIICLFSLGLAVGVIFAVGFLFFVQMKAILKNQTGIEDWVIEKAFYRREGTEDKVFLHPYNLGWRENLSHVLNWSFQPKGDGIKWKVREGSNIYTFTIEQIEQKKLKRERAVEYFVNTTFNGRWFPLHFGIRVCFNPPCSDEKRLALKVGDKVVVTRWKRYWLYGEILERDNMILLNPLERRELRGWFPRVCCYLANEVDVKKDD